MARDAVFDFITRTETDAALRDALGSVHGSDGIVALAARHGFQFTSSELAPALTLVRFLQALGRDGDLRDQLDDAADLAAVARFARDHGYELAPDDLAHVGFTRANDSGALTDGQLEGVAGGSIRQVASTGLRVQLQSSVQRQTTGSSFGSVLKAGLSSSAGVLGGASIAAPFVPGGAILSAAIDD